MKQKFAQRLIIIIFLLSIVNYIVAATGFYSSGKSNKTPVGQLYIDGGESVGEKDNPEEKPAEKIFSETGQDVELQEEPAENYPVTEGIMGRWPNTSVIGQIFSPDLAQYQGKKETGQPLQGIHVILDPGHGGSDPGTEFLFRRSPSEEEQSLLEKDIVLKLSFLVKENLENLGAKVAMTRTEDVWRSIFYRPAFTGKYILNYFSEVLEANEYNQKIVTRLEPFMQEIIDINDETPEGFGRGVFGHFGSTEDVRLLFDIEKQFENVIFLSIHVNSNYEKNDAKSKGASVYYTTNESTYEQLNIYNRDTNFEKAKPAYQNYDDAKRKHFADLIYQGIIERIPALVFSGNSGTIPGNYVVTRDTALTSAMVEVGYIDQEADRNILLDEKEQANLAEAMSHAIYKFYCQ